VQVSEEGNTWRGSIASENRVRGREKKKKEASPVRLWEKKKRGKAGPEKKKTQNLQKEKRSAPSSLRKKWGKTFFRYTFISFKKNHLRGRSRLRGREAQIARERAPQEKERTCPTPPAKKEKETRTAKKKGGPP